MNVALTNPYMINNIVVLVPKPGKSFASKTMIQLTSLPGFFFKIIIIVIIIALLNKYISFNHDIRKLDIIGFFSVYLGSSVPHFLK